MSKDGHTIKAIDGCIWRSQRSKLSDLEHYDLEKNQVDTSNILKTLKMA